MFPPCELFSFYFLHENFTIHSSQGGKTLVFPLAGETFVFAVKSKSGTFARAFYEDRSWFLTKFALLCFYFNFPYLFIG